MPSSTRAGNCGSKTYEKDAVERTDSRQPFGFRHESLQLSMAHGDQAGHRQVPNDRTFAKYAEVSTTMAHTVRNCFHPKTMLQLEEVKRFDDIVHAIAFNDITQP